MYIRTYIHKCIHTCMHLMSLCIIYQHACACACIRRRERDVAYAYVYTYMHLCVYIRHCACKAPMECFSSWAQSSSPWTVLVREHRGSFRISRGLPHDLWPLKFCCYFFIRQNRPQRSQNHPESPKEVPIEHNLGSFWSHKWKYENNGFVYAKP